MHGHPRPLLRRREWQSLDGEWEFALDREGKWRQPRDVEWHGTIIVPFAPETPASGVGETGYFRGCWYRRRLEAVPIGADERLILHLGAVDYAATVSVDGVVCATHEGGYTPFWADVTDLLRQPGTHDIVIHAEDDPLDLAKPRGKQDWEPAPHGIWYVRGSGVWQTVWLERVPATRIEHLRWTPNLERWEITVEVSLAGDWRPGLRAGVRLTCRGHVLADDSYALTGDEICRRITLSDPGVDDSRNAVLWSPESPTLIDAEITLTDRDGTVIDQVESYTALRSTGVQGDRFMLNGRAYGLRLVLDQGYWPETGMTAPNDEALRRDVELAKEMGFNGVRKHQKIEDPRYLYWADRLGLLVWEEMPSTYRFTWRSVQRLTREWMEVIARDYSHPCVVVRVPFNESWGVPNLPEKAEERGWVHALYHLTKTLDPTRPVVGNDGWESVATDILGIHDYDPDPERIARRYHAEVHLPRFFRRERPGGRTLVLNGRRSSRTPIVLTEFGGIALAKSSDPASWGYSTCDSAEHLRETYTRLLTTVRSLELLAGFCYTQFTDTYQEANGLLRADRTPKFPLPAIRAATSGRPPPPYGA